MPPGMGRATPRSSSRAMSTPTLWPPRLTLGSRVGAVPPRHDRRFPARRPPIGRAFCSSIAPARSKPPCAPGHVGIPRLDPHYTDALVLNQILGGQFNSRLNSKLREEKGFTYGIRSHFDGRNGAGPFSIAASLQSDRLAEALADLREELLALRDDRPPTTLEVDDARRSLVEGQARHFETPSALVSRYAGLFVHGLPLDEHARFPERLAAVTVESLTTAANRLLVPESLVYVVVADAANVHDSLRARLGRGHTPHRLRGNPGNLGVDLFTSHGSGRTNKERNEERPPPTRLSVGSSSIPRPQPIDRPLDGGLPQCVPSLLASFAGRVSSSAGSGSGSIATRMTGTDKFPVGASASCFTGRFSCCSRLWLYVQAGSAVTTSKADSRRQLMEDLTSLGPSDHAGDPFTRLKTAEPPSLSLVPAPPNETTISQPEIPNVSRFTPDLSGPDTPEPSETPQNSKALNATVARPARAGGLRAARALSLRACIRKI